MTLADFEKFVDLTLADGVITPQEQQALVKRAAELNLSPDEVQIIIEARVHEMNQRKEQQAKTAAAPAPAASNKAGNVRKCPACGAPITGTSTSCPECGHVFTGVAAVSSATRLFEMIQEAQTRASKALTEHEARKNQRLADLDVKQAESTNLLTEKQNEGGTMAKIMASKTKQQAERAALAQKHAQERQDLVRELERSRAALSKDLMEEKRQIIKNFPVPNTREDLMELLAMASSNAYDNDGVIGPEEEVWIQKTDQIYTKIKAVSKNDKDLLEEATNVVIGLMSRLPNAYKHFTSLPTGYESRMAEQVKAARENKKEMKKEALRDSLMAYKTWIVGSGAAVLFGLLLMLCGAAIFGFLIFVVGLCVGGKMIKKGYDNYNVEKRNIEAY